jgi:hypothetical protein
MSSGKDRTLAGIVSCIPIQLIHPIDLIKTRMQVADPSGNSNIPVIRKYRHMASYIIQQEGFKGLYKGVAFSVFPNIMIGMYFFFNPIVKRKLTKYSTFASNETLTIITANISISAVMSFLLTPLYVLKTRKLTDTTIGNKNKNVWKIGREVRQTMGIKGFLRGASMTFLMGLNGGITMGLIDLLISKYHIKDDDNLANFLIGGSARFFTSLFFYPFSTVRARVEQNQIFENLSGLKYKGITDCFAKTYKNEGIGAFYNGFLANSTRSFIMTGCMIFIYRRFYSYLQQKHRKN